MSRTSGFSTVIVMASTGLSRLLGFFRLAVIGAVFGGGHVADVLNAVFLIPNNLRKLLAEGALSTAFIPVLSRTVHEDPSLVRPGKLVGAVFGFQLWILIPLITLCFVAAQPLSSVLFPFSGQDIQIMVQGAPMVVNKAAMSAQLFPWMMQYLVFVSFSAILMAILNVHGEFVTPALAPLMFSTSVITMLLVFNTSMFVWAQVLGVLLGGLLQLSILVFGFRKFRYRARVDFLFWRNKDFRHVLVLMVPVIGSSVIFTITEVLATMFAASMAPGSTSALANAVVFWQLPFGIFSASVATVLFPKMSRLIAAGDDAELKSTIGTGLKLNMYLLIPSSVLLFCFSELIIAVAMQRGSFTSENTRLTAQVLRAYSVGVFAMGCTGFIQRYLYAAKHQRMAFRGAIFIAIIDVLISVAGLFAGLDVSILAWANTLASLAGLAWLVWYLTRSLPGLGVRHLWAALAKSLAAAVPIMLLGLLYLYIWPGAWQNGSTLENWIAISTIGIASVLAVLFMYRLLRADEFLTFFKRSKAT